MLHLLPGMVLIGWITLCTGATPPSGRWPTIPTTLSETRADCEAANVRANKILAAVFKAAPRPGTETVTCWCAPVTPPSGQVVTWALVPWAPPLPSAGGSR